MLGRIILSLYKSPRNQTLSKTCEISRKAPVQYFFSNTGVFIVFNYFQTFIKLDILDIFYKYWWWLPGGGRLCGLHVIFRSCFLEALKWIGSDELWLIFNTGQVDYCVYYVSCFRIGYFWCAHVMNFYLRNRVESFCVAFAYVMLMAGTHSQRTWNAWFSSYWCSLVDDRSLLAWGDKMIMSQLTGRRKLCSE